MTIEAMLLLNDLVRTGTFIGWPSHSSQTRSRTRPKVADLVRAGFYFTGIGDVVRCFSCGVQIGAWKRHHDPFLIHAAKRPQCVFVVNSVGCQRAEPHRTNTEPYRRNPEPNRTNSNPLSTNLEPHRTNIEPHGTNSDPYSTNSEPHISTANIDNASHHPDNPSVSTSRHFSCYQKFRESDEVRLETFRAWVGPTETRAREFAKAGFIYTGAPDRMQCVFCGGVLRDWSPEDSPLEEHRKHFPCCPYVRNSNTGLHKPRHLKFRSEKSRISSFIDWDPSWNPKPAVLAKAGFFSTGHKDNVRCFFCDLSLGYWEPGDDPWTEHVRWFPKCPYVKQLKGQEFVDRILCGSEEQGCPSASPGEEDASQLSGQHGYPHLLKEYRLLKEQRECKICFNGEVSVTFTPCGHLVCCSSCAACLQRCPICRAEVRARIDTYMS